MGNNTEQSFPLFNFIHNRGAEGRWSSDSFKLNGPLPPLLTANYQCYTWLIIAHVTVLLRESQVLQMRSSLRNRLRILSCYTWALIRKIPSKWSPLISISNILYVYFYPALSRMSWVMAQHSHTLFCILSLYSFTISTIYKISDSPTDATFQFGQWYRAWDRGQVRGDPGEASPTSGVRSPAQRTEGGRKHNSDSITIHEEEESDCSII